MKLPFTLIIIFLLLIQKANAQSCKADFDTTKTYESCPNPQIDIFFQNESIGNNLSSLWIITRSTGDTLDISKAVSPLVQFSIPGIYNVQLIISNTSTGCRDSVKYDSLVNIGGPNGQFTINHMTGCIPLTVTLSGRTNGALYSTILFGNYPFTDTLSLYDTINYTTNFTGLGNINCQVKLSDGGNCTVTYDVGEVTVFNCDTPCKANFDVLSISSRCPPLPVQFTNYSQGDNYLNLWKFGDGSTSSDLDPLHVYYFPGNYNVTLVIEDSLGCKDSITFLDPVIIGGPIGHFSLSPDSGCVPLSVTITGTAQSTASITADLGDGFVFYDVANLVHTYTNPGDYYPVYTLTDSSGCSVGYWLDSIKVTVSCDTMASVNDNTLKDNKILTLFPNPATDYITFESNTIQNLEPDAVFSIYNQLGQTIYTQILNPQHNQSIHVAFLAPGFYIASLKHNSETMSIAKFIKQ